MNYRHAFHAGNFADVIKHIVLARILCYLRQKPAPFRVIDSHAGAGLYDLEAEEAERGGEWLSGIARILQARFSEPALELVRPYLDVVREFNPPGKLQIYPGSPLIARRLLRPQDRLVACELEPGARRALIRALHRDPQARVVDLDGWVALGAFVPAQERRGLVLIDPPFEAGNEFERLAEVFARTFARWPGGVYMIWYPAKSGRASDALAEAVVQAAGAGRKESNCLRLEFSVAPQSRDSRLTSAGLLIVNPPFTLRSELRVILPELEKPLGQGGAARFHLEAPKPARC
ncbi:MAG: 23S rRNA (adenine(2030)-N(6))-methyltransferase RlmJ [Alphaproteobacteria bacterium]|nr:23S rRNA (adenine(2030)-N(6))-methyltransferase RlmJ [Alphaproteobacteria bacterium]